MARTIDENQMGQQLLYPLDDPTAAFTNALQDLGINPYRSNPFTEALKKNAQGARISYLSDMSKMPANVLSTPGYATPSEGFGNYLKGQISQGNLIGQMTRHAQDFGGTLDTVREYEKQLASGQNAADLNPYTAALRDIFAAENGKGALGAYGALRSPRLGALSGSYGRAIGNVGDAAVRRFAQEGTLNDDVWKWMFNGGVF